MLLRVFLLVAITFSIASCNQDKSESSTKGEVSRVADGDTLTIDLTNGSGEQLKVRLCGIDAPEKAQPLGKESGDYLKKMVLGKQVAITEIEKDRYGRTVAEVFVLSDPEIFVNGDMVQAGLAYHYQKYSGKCPNRDAISQAEAIAQSKRAGVWGGNTIKPWDYRAVHR